MRVAIVGAAPVVLRDIAARVAIPGDAALPARCCVVACARERVYRTAGASGSVWSVAEPVCVLPVAEPSQPFACHWPVYVLPAACSPFQFVPDHSPVYWLYVPQPERLQPKPRSVAASSIGAVAAVDGLKLAAEISAAKTSGASISISNTDDTDVGVGAPSHPLVTESVSIRILRAW